MLSCATAVSPARRALPRMANEPMARSAHALRIQYRNGQLRPYTAVERISPCFVPNQNRSADACPLLQLHDAPKPFRLHVQSRAATTSRQIVAIYAGIVLLWEGQALPVCVRNNGRRQDDDAGWCEAAPPVMHAHTRGRDDLKSDVGCVIARRVTHIRAQ